MFKGSVSRAKIQIIIKKLKELNKEKFTREELDNMIMAVAGIKKVSIGAYIKRIKDLEFIEEDK